MFCIKGCLFVSAGSRETGVMTTFSLPLALCNMIMSASG